MKPGDKIPAKVISLDGEEGLIELSLAEAGKQRQWQGVQDLMESGEIVKFKPTASNMGGLIGTLLDLKAFLPISQLSSEVDLISQIFYLSEGEKELLLTADIGEGLFFAGQNHVAIKVLAAPFEHDIITSNPEEILANMPEKLPPPLTPESLPETPITHVAPPPVSSPVAPTPARPATATPKLCDAPPGCNT
jgi:hypothetical protein